MIIDYSTKRIVAIIAATILLIIFPFYIPGITDSLPNRVGVISGIGSIGMGCAFASNYKPWQLGTFISGLFLLLVGIGFYITMVSFSEAATAARNAGKFTADDVIFWTYGIDLWKYTIPVIGIAMGVNIISSFINATPPSKNDGNLE